VGIFLKSIAGLGLLVLVLLWLNLHPYHANPFGHSAQPPARVKTWSAWQ
jgi:hypothetical protein